MRFGSTSGRAVLVLSALLLAAPFGCGKKEKGKEAVAALPDSLVQFRQKIGWLIPRSFESLEYACRNKADEVMDAAINLNAFVPPAKFLSLFQGVEVKFQKLYYGWETFGSVFTVDPNLPADSTMALLQVEARGRISDRIRVMEEELRNVTEETARERAEAELAELRKGLAHVEAEGALIYGAEVRAYPEDLKGLMFRPEGIIRVIFPGVPQEGSWVRISPYYFDRMMKADEAADQARAEVGT
jgi:hypothetical protein